MAQRRIAEHLVVNVYRIGGCIDLFSCTATRVFNKLTNLLTYLLIYLLTYSQVYVSLRRGEVAERRFALP